MTKSNPTPDFIVHAGEWATVWGFEPQNEVALDFIEELGGEDWQWNGKIFYTDHRPARDLARYMVGEGFVVMHPQYGYFGG